MKSKTKITKQLQRKNNIELVETIQLAKKNNWIEVAGTLSGPTKKRPNLNLEEINKKSKEKDIVLIPGKVLSLGNIDKKIKIIALNFSEEAEKKLLKAKIDFSTIKEEIKKNPDAKGVKILK